MFESDRGLSTLIICPKNLVKMWQTHADCYGLHAKVVPFSRVDKELPNVPARFRLLLIDESHNLRNREGRRYRAIQEYILQTDSKCILLSATPYNKTYLDLANQLRLFVPEDNDLGIRPEQLLREIGETEFLRRHQCHVRSLAAFEKSVYADDWRELMRLYMVRRTRTFIQENYAETDAATGRKFLTFADGTRSYFPHRFPKTVKFKINNQDPSDQYARLYADDVVDAINHLDLPRYGLGNYLLPKPKDPPTTVEARVMQDLSRAGRRLMGFCRTNLFKRLESSGLAFIQSVQRHILRNYVYLHAIEHGLPVPIGTQDAELLDSRFSDEDTILPFNDDDAANGGEATQGAMREENDYTARAAAVYNDYAESFQRRFKWLKPTLFVKQLATDLRDDIDLLQKVLVSCGHWDAAKDAKLDALWKLVAQKHRNQKVLVFSQFADTVRYLDAQLRCVAFPMWLVSAVKPPIPHPWPGGLARKAITNAARSSLTRNCAFWWPPTC